jgi:hypothetical protein
MHADCLPHLLARLNTPNLERLINDVYDSNGALIVSERSTLNCLNRIGYSLIDSRRLSSHDPQVATNGFRGPSNLSISGCFYYGSFLRRFGQATRPPVVSAPREAYRTIAPISRLCLGTCPSSSWYSTIGLQDEVLMVQVNEAHQIPIDGVTCLQLNLTPFPSWVLAVQDVKAEFFQPLRK